MSMLKTIFTYALFLTIGCGLGYVVTQAPRWLAADYETGDYARYLPKNAAPVVLYGTTWCGFCKATREYFQKKGVAFVDLDIESNPEAQLQYQALKGVGVPVVLIGERRINGFRPEVMDEALKAANVPRAMAVAQVDS